MTVAGKLLETLNEGRASFINVTDTDSNTLEWIIGKVKEAKSDILYYLNDQFDFAKADIYKNLILAKMDQGSDDYNVEVTVVAIVKTRDMPSSDPYYYPLDITIKLDGSGDVRTGSKPEQTLYPEGSVKSNEFTEPSKLFQIVLKAQDGVGI